MAVLSAGGLGWAASCESTCTNPFRWGEPRTEAVDEFLQHEFAFLHVFRGIVGFFDDAFDEGSLHPIERLGRLAAFVRQPRMGVAPGVQLAGALLLLGGLLTDKFFQQLIVAVASRGDIAQHAKLFAQEQFNRATRRGIIRGRDVDLSEKTRRTCYEAETWRPWVAVA